MDLGMFFLELGRFQIYGMLFLLGSLSVATISDLKRMAAQKEFFHFWIAFTLFIFLGELYLNLSKPLKLEFVGKWSLVVLVSLLSYSRRGLLFKTSKMDVASIAAVCSALNVFSILVLVPLMQLFSFVARSFSHGNKYPFLPVVFVSVSVILALNIIPPLI